MISRKKKKSRLSNCVISSSDSRQPVREANEMKGWREKEEATGSDGPCGPLVTITRSIDRVSNYHVDASPSAGLLQKDGPSCTVYDDEDDDQDDSFTCSCSATDKALNSRLPSGCRHALYESVGRSCHLIR